MKMRCLTGLVALIASSAAAADTIHVPAGGDIQGAIDIANDGDLITLAAGLYLPETSIDTLGKSITIRGTTDSTGLPDSLMDGRQQIRVIDCTGTGEVKLENLDIRGGFTRDQGAGIQVSGGSVEIRNCNIVGNSAQSGGGLHLIGARADLFGCTFRGNTASTQGGAIWAFINAELNATDCLFGDNTAANNGGAITVDFWAVLKLTNCAFTGNSSPGYGGGVFTNGISDLKGCSFGLNSANRGGGLYQDDDGETIISASVFSENVASTLGGAIFTEPGGSLEISDSLLCGSSPDAISGEWQDGGGNSFQKSCTNACLSDIDGDSIVDGSDLNFLLASWGTDGSTVEGSDINDDGLVDGTDLNILLGAWGVCP